MIGEQHVLPVGDLIEHELEHCPCGPSHERLAREDGTDEWMVVHHSLDGREREEA